VTKQGYSASERANGAQANASCSPLCRSEREISFGDLESTMDARVAMEGYHDAGIYLLSAENAMTSFTVCAQLQRMSAKMQGITWSLPSTVEIGLVERNDEVPRGGVALKNQWSLRIMGLLLQGKRRCTKPSQAPGEINSIPPVSPQLSAAQDGYAFAP
jgi:hypothetical protein